MFTNEILQMDGIRDRSSGRRILDRLHEMAEKKARLANPVDAGLEKIKIEGREERQRRLRRQTGKSGENLDKSVGFEDHELKLGWSVVLAWNASEFQSGLNA